MQTNIRTENHNIRKQGDEITFIFTREKHELKLKFRVLIWCLSPSSHLHHPKIRVSFRKSWDHEKKHYITLSVANLYSYCRKVIFCRHFFNVTTKSHTFGDIFYDATKGGTFSGDFI